MKIGLGGLQIGFGVLEVVGGDDLLVEEGLVAFVVGLRLGLRGFGATHGILRLLDPAPQIPVVQHHQCFSAGDLLAGRNPHFDDVRHHTGGHCRDLLGLDGTHGLGNGGEHLGYNLLRGEAGRRLLGNRLLAGLDHSPPERTENPEHQDDDCGDGQTHPQQRGQSLAPRRFYRFDGRGVIICIFRRHRGCSFPLTSRRPSACVDRRGPRYRSPTCAAETAAVR